LIFYLENSLGSWDFSVYKGDKENGPGDTYAQLGKYYTVFILLANMVLFLNFVIAILSSTFAFYEDKKLGLYYEVIVALFPVMDFDEQYGAVVCAQPPFNLMILPFQWVTVFPLSDEILTKYNEFLCHLLFFPIGLVITLCFMILDIFCLPFAYLVHCLSLI
jgi:hypothetical protein